MENLKYRICDIDDYANRLNSKQSEDLLIHCDKYDIAPDICAWYDDMDDFYTDWIYDNNICADEEEADKRFKTGCEEGEFLLLDDGQIVRLSL